MPCPATLCEAAEKVTRAWTVKRKLQAVLPIERKLEAGLRAAFTKQGRLFLEALEGKRLLWPVRQEGVPSGAAFGWEAEFDKVAKATAPVFAGALTQAVGAAMQAGTQGSFLTGGLTIAFDLQHPRAVAYMAEHGAQLVTKIDDTSKARIASIIARNLEEGVSYNDTAKQLRAEFQDFSRDRAHLIAVTEAGHAYEHGNREAVQQLVDAGLEMEKAWIAVGDEDTCPICEGNDEAGWLPMDEEFPEGGMTTEDSHPGCRCATEYRVMEAKEG